MRTFKLHESRLTNAGNGTPYFDEHYLFTEPVTTRFELPEHQTGLGIVHNLSGEGTVMLNGVRNKVSQDYFLPIDSESRLAMSIQKSDTQPILLYFQTGVPGHVAASLYYSPERLIDEPSVIYDVDFSLMERLQIASPSLKSRLKLLTTLPDNCSSFFTLKADGIVRSILENILVTNSKAMREARQLKVIKKSTRVEMYKRLCVAKDWIDSNFNRSISLTDMAEIAHLNSQHFLRLFKQLFRKTPHQYLIEVRLEEAKRLIATSTLSISEICNRVGWDSLASFSKLFKHRAGFCPSDFRLSCKDD